MGMHTRVLRLLTDNDIPRICALVRVQLEAGASTMNMLATLERAISGQYKVKSYSASERDQCMLIMRLGGPRLLTALQETGGLAGLTTVHKWLKDIVVFTFCHEGFHRATVAANITSAYSTPRKTPKIAVCDEISVTPRFDVKLSDNVVTGVCWEHRKGQNLKFTSSEVFDHVVKQTDNGSIHLAREALVFAVGDLGAHNYHVIPLLGVGSCKTGGRERAKDIILDFVRTWHEVGEPENGPLWLFGTDGDPCRRGACNDIFREVEVEEDFGNVLRALEGLDIKCSRIGSTVAVNDHKHMGKRARKWVTSEKRSNMIGDFALTAAVTKQWLAACGVQDVKRMFDVSDKMRVRVAFDLLDAVAGADPDVPTIGKIRNTFPHSLRIMSVICECMGAPMSPSMRLELQLTKLSQLSHVIGFLFSLHGSKFMMWELVSDLQGFVKAAFFVTARGQADDGFDLYLFQLGSDSIEELFGTVRTVDHNVNVSTCELETKLSIATQVRDIGARHPDWSPPDRRRGARGERDIIRPRETTESVKCKDVNLLKAWADGRDAAEKVLVPVSSQKAVTDYWKAISQPGCSLLCPDGHPIGTKRARRTNADDDGQEEQGDDEDGEAEEEEEEEDGEEMDRERRGKGAGQARERSGRGQGGGMEMTGRGHERERSGRGEGEDRERGGRGEERDRGGRGHGEQGEDDDVTAEGDDEDRDDAGGSLLGEGTPTVAEADGTIHSSTLPPEMYSVEAKGSPWLMIDGKKVHKRTYIAAKTARWRPSKNRLERVRYHPPPTATVHESVQHFQQLDNAVWLRDPAAGLCVAEGKVCLVVFAVVKIQQRGNSVLAISADTLDDSVVVHGQALKLERHDSETLKWGHVQTANVFPTLFRCKGSMVQPLTPATSEEGDEACWLFDLIALADTAASLWEQHGAEYRSCHDVLPKLPVNNLPADSEGLPLDVSDAGVGGGKSDRKRDCPLCQMSVKRSFMRAHIGSHILTETIPNHCESTCGFCGSSGCTYSVDRKGVPTFLCPFAKDAKYKFATATNATSPCSNVLVHCTQCLWQKDSERSSTFFWKYNMSTHVHKEHRNGGVGVDVHTEKELQRMIDLKVACTGAREFLLDWHNA
eukprot:GHVU01007729.1.p1 GENE.GHVU01007729.1~~GHVU01007729.1.p1  ORF type:complete len:1183 (-),score=175.19 GHVU01007729.1:272-3604(-)